jgi:hypothetical protein
MLKAGVRLARNGITVLKIKNLYCECQHEKIIVNRCVLTHNLKKN